MRQRKKSEMSSSRLWEGEAISLPSKSEKLVVFSWWGLFLAALACAIAPTDSWSQGILAVGLLLVLTILRVYAHEDRDNWMRISLLLIASFLSVRYIFWRGAYTLWSSDPISIVAAVTLFLAEAYALFIHLVGVFVNIYPRKRAELLLDLDLPPSQVPRVDILVPSYNEDVSLVEITLRAACAMHYPEGRAQVYLLDDGGTDQKCSDPNPAKREEALERRKTFQALCARLGVHYLARARNEHAKAGNINAALQRTDGDLVVIFDADHVPTVDFLQRTVPWFMRDPKVFLVQTPHFMVNPDPIDRNLLRAFRRMPAENDMFYAGVQKGLDYWESSFFCGSAAMLRREPVMSIGGIQGTSITEDAETALDLHARGWKSIYLDRPMVAGLAPESFSGFVIQRMRWTQGMTQLLLLKNPMLKRGLSWFQRLSYLSSTVFWLFPFARLVFILAPLAYLFFGLQVYNASVPQILSYTVPHIIGSFFVINMLFQRVRWPLISELYETMQSVYSVRALAEVFRNPHKPKFVVTPKGERLDEDFVSPLARPFYVLFFLISVGFLFGWWRLFSNPLTQDMTAVVMFWNTFNFMFVFAAFGALLERRQRRAAPRMPHRFDAEISLGSGSRVPVLVTDLSAHGARLELSEGQMSQYSGLRGHLHAHIQADRREISLEMQVRMARGHGNGIALGVRFTSEQEVQKRDAVLLMYGSSDVWLDILRRRTRPMPFFRAISVLLILTLKPILEHWAFVERMLRDRIRYLLKRSTWQGWCPIPAERRPQKNST